MMAIESPPSAPCKSGHQRNGAWLEEAERRVWESENLKQPKGKNRNQKTREELRE